MMVRWSGECQVNVKSQSELDIGGRETCIYFQLATIFIHPFCLLGLLNVCIIICICIYNIIDKKLLWRTTFLIVSMKRRPLLLMPMFKVFFLLICLGISLLQSYHEIDNYLEKRILTSSDIVDVENAPIHLVFCDTYPLENRVCIVKLRVISHVKPWTSEMTLR